MNPESLEPQPQQPSPESISPSNLQERGRGKRANPGLALLGLFYAASLGIAVVLMLKAPQSPAQNALPKKTSTLSLLNFDDKTESIGIVRLEGIITMDRRGSFLGENMIDRVKKNLERMMKKKQVKAVILRINSPGGTAFAVRAPSTSTWSS